MSFSFGFSGDDIEDDHDSPNDLATKLNDTKITPSHSTTLLQPKRHTLAELLQSLPSQISYNWLDVPLHTDHAQPSLTGEERDGRERTSVKVPRREVHDIRQQLMAEVDLDDSGTDATDSLLEGLATGDLSTGIYEGGFKTWECAVDLAGFVTGMNIDADGTGTGEQRIIELGAGSAIPSLVLLQKVLRERSGTGTGDKKDRGKGRVRFTLCDYNEDVLRLCTAVNVFLSIVPSGTDGTEESEGGEEGHMEVNETLTQKALQTLKDADIEIDFISGAWGDAFLQLLYSERQSAVDSSPSQSHTRVLASETIYSPDSLGPFSKLLVDILEEERRTANGRAEVFVAAKKVYFGVGGGVAEFEEEMRQLGGTTRTVLDVKGAGVGRVVLEVSIN
ncbi:hypothetical protein PMZ80_006889 [Knufia obscura]|uniref:protein-histidine N-methyltransferase n=1 Tax=Knufia obscura TaxID=1635080 RepID=A0ABR0RJS3_9EURO|nr:hypothetical protein PMZ80_006889 [Knufia obscura]